MGARSTPPGGRRVGFTLAELLVTIAIIAILMTLSVGVLSRLGSRDRLQATQQALRSLIRRAHNAAREERYPVRIELDLAEGRIEARQRTAVAFFAFERMLAPVVPEGEALLADEPALPQLESEGARGDLITVEGGEQVEGRFGGGVVFEAEADEGAAWAWVPDRPALTPLAGVWVECWLRLGPLETRLHDRKERTRTRRNETAWREEAGDPPREAPERLVDYDPARPPIFWAIRKGSSYGLGVTAAYEVEWVVTGPGAGPGGDAVSYVARTRPGTLRPDRWIHVAAWFDGRGAGVVVDGIPRSAVPAIGSEELPTRLTRQPGVPLALSDPDPRQAFYGVLDEVRVAAIVRASGLELPADIALAAPGPVVGFDMLGQLDPALHPEPVVLYLADDDRLWAADAPEDPTRTRTRDPDAPPPLPEGPTRFVGQAGFAAFERLLPSLSPGRVRRLVISRAGLVTE